MSADVTTIAEWTGCYDDGWRGLIVADAFAHPAKFSRGLIERIILHGIERGYWKPGDTLADPFGGVALGGIIAGYHGLNWRGVELEEKFWKLGNANIDLHRAKWKALGYDVDVRLLQGDSRRFAELVRASAIITSPPYAESLEGESGNGHHRVGERMRNETRKGRKCQDMNYDGHRNNIGNLKSGDIDAVITSPPFVDSLADKPSQSVRRQLGKTMGRSVLGQDGYGMTNGQIGALKSGDIDAVVTSPPYGKDALDHAGGEGPRTTNAAHSKSGTPNSQTYGNSDGNIQNLSNGDLETVTKTQYNHSHVKNHMGMDRRILRGRGMRDLVRGGEAKEKQESGGRSGGRDNSRPEGEIASTNDIRFPCQGGILGSESLLEEAVQIEIREDGLRLLDTPDNSEVGESVVSPIGDSLPHLQTKKGGGDIEKNIGSASGEADQQGHNDNANKVGRGGKRNTNRKRAGRGCSQNAKGLAQQRETYWEAVYKVYCQCWLALKPGGIMVVVVKDYCQQKKIVPLCDQTMKLLEHVGFKPVERIRAMLSETSEHETLFGGTHRRTKDRKSFFRRLAESKGSPRIDWEEVLIVRKP